MHILLLLNAVFFFFIKSNWSAVSFKTSVSLLIFCLEDLSIDVSVVLNSPIFLCFGQFLPLYLFELYIFQFFPPYYNQCCIKNLGTHILKTDSLNSVE